MEIKEQIEKVLSSITNDKSLMDDFKKDPIALVKKYLGNALPDDALEKIVAGVKAKLGADKLADVAESLGKLFK